MPRGRLGGWAEVIRVAFTPPYRNYMFANIGDDIGTWMFRTTIGWVVWSLSESPALLGLITIAMLGPNVVLGLFGGVLADHYDRRTVIRITHASSGALMILLAGLVAIDLINLTIVFTILILRGIVNALAQASSKAIVPRLVPAADLGTAVALNSVTFNIATFIGPPIAGFIIAAGGGATSMLIAGLLTLSYVWALLAIPPEPPAETATRSAFGYMTDIVEGLRHCWNRALLRALFVLHFTFAALMRPFLDFIPGIADQIFGGGIVEIAWLTGSVGVGAVVGGLWLARNGERAMLARIALAAAIVLGFAIAATVWLPWLALGVAANFVVGFSSIARGAAIQTMTQLAAEERMRGRIMAVYSTIMNGGAVFGGLAMGLVAEFVGLRDAITVGVVAALVVWALMRSHLLRETAAFEEAPTP
jgi:MFS family permease